ncbi:MAG: hypothetical protein E7409_00625 [Ruminococcaceae bacterium]|nr:hypothetical protein [Oscillospiraceae bacterium]
MKEIIKPGFFNNNTADANDARREHYDVLNEQLVNMGKEPDVLFIGDSITINWELRLYLDDLGYMVNRGIGGDNTHYINRRAEADVFQLNPKRVVYMAGTNDLMATLPDMWWQKPGRPAEEVVAQSLANIEDFAKRCGNTKLFLCSVIPSSLYETFDKDAYNRAILMLNEGIKALCEKYNATYVDYHSALCQADGMTVQDGLTHEGIHPNHKGYSIMSEVLRKAIAERG